MSDRQTILNINIPLFLSPSAHQSLPHAVILVDVEGVEHLHGEGEDDGGVLLSRDAAQCLEISELESCRGLTDGVRRLPQRPAGLLFSLGRHHLGPGLPGGLGLGGHDSLELEGQPHVLDLHPLHVDAPGVRGHLQVVVHAVRNGLPVGQDLREVPGPEDVPDVFLL